MRPGSGQSRTGHARGAARTWRRTARISGYQPLGYVTRNARLCRARRRKPPRVSQVCRLRTVGTLPAGFHPQRPFAIGSSPDFSVAAQHGCMCPHHWPAGAARQEDTGTGPGTFLGPENRPASVAFQGTRILRVLVPHWPPAEAGRPCWGRWWPYLPGCAGPARAAPG